MMTPEKQPYLYPSISLHESIGDSCYPEFDTSPEEARNRLIDGTIAPYHTHYLGGGEGQAANPEGSEFTFDSLIVLTAMIRNKQKPAKDINSDSPLAYLPDPELDWYFDKYEGHGVTKQDFDSPYKIVQTWLAKLGPHNNLSGAVPDLESAREWLVQENDKKAGSSSDPSKEIVNKELDLIAELDLELGDLADGPRQLLYLRESAAYLDRYVGQMESTGMLINAIKGRMKLSAVRLEMQRIRTFGSNRLTNIYSEAQYSALENAAQAELTDLKTYLTDCLEETKLSFGPETFSELTGKEAHSHSRRYIHVSATLFELFTFAKALDGIIGSSRLTVDRIRPGTYREESSTAHKIDGHPKNRKLKQADGSALKLDSHNFNYNFDFLLTTVDTKHSNGGSLAEEKVYLQNKLRPAHAPEDEATIASSRLGSSKQFLFLTPKTLIKDFVADESNGKYLDYLITKMADSI